MIIYLPNCHQIKILRAAWKWKTNGWCLWRKYGGEIWTPFRIDRTPWHEISPFSPQAFRGRNRLLERLVIGWHKCVATVLRLCVIIFWYPSRVWLVRPPSLYLISASVPFLLFDRRRILFEDSFRCEINASFLFNKDNKI